MHFCDNTPFVTLFVVCCLFNLFLSGAIKPVASQDDNWLCLYVFSPSQLKTEFLPLLSVIFVSENSLVAAVRINHTHYIFSCTNIQLVMNVIFKWIWSASSGSRLLPNAVPLRRWWNADICVKARPPEAEYPEEHLRYGALQEHGQESHHRGPQHCPGHTASEQHHVSHMRWNQWRTGCGINLRMPSLR